MSVRIDAKAVIDPTSRIGTDPFSRRRIPVAKLIIRKEGKGGVWVKAWAKIGGNATIQKGLTRPTEIGYYTDINDGVHIGHDVKIGQRCIVGLGSTISGYTEIGDDVEIGPGCTISNKIKIGDKARVRIGSLVIHDIPAGGDYAGIPAIPFEEFKRQRMKLKELLGVE